MRYLKRRESKTDQEVGGPVGDDGNRGGHGASGLVEEFGDEEPGDRAGTGGESDDKEDDHGDGEVGQCRHGSLI